MSGRTARAVFDCDRFRADVLAYIARWRLSRRALTAATSGIGLTSVLEFLRGERDVSLLLACELAEVCDLSLDAYRVAS